MRRAIVVIVLLAPVLAVAQENPPPPAEDRAQTAPNRNGPGRFQGVRGTITAIAGNQLSLKTADGKAVTVNLTKDTQYRKDRQPAALADFKVGDAVMVAGDPAGENAWTARFVLTRVGGGEREPMAESLGKRFIAGEIKAIDGTSLTILRPDGQTQTIQVDENTSFRKQEQSVTLADFKPGDHVFGRGEVKNGSFVPAVLNWGDPQAMGRGRPQGAPDPR
jgi:ribosomal protein L21E